VGISPPLNVSVVKLYSLTVDPAALCAVTLNVYLVSGWRSNIRNGLFLLLLLVRPSPGSSLTLLLTSTHEDEESKEEDDKSSRRLYSITKLEQITVTKNNIEKTLKKLKN
jgi:hypothetical protein